MTDDETRALYDVPALDADGRPITVRLRPDRAKVTVEIIEADGSPVARFAVSIAYTGQFSSFFNACALAAAWAGGTS